MNDEIKKLSERVKPLVDQVAQQQGVEFKARTSELLRQFYEVDETAQFLFESFVTRETLVQNCGGFAVTNASQLEKIYQTPPNRGNELIDNRIFVFAIDGDGSFFGFNLGDRRFYHFDFGPWHEEELPWAQTTSDNWDVDKFCSYFEGEFAANS